MKKIKQRVLIVLITLGIWGHSYCVELNIPEGKQLEKCLYLVNDPAPAYVTERNLQNCGISKKFTDWTDADFELLRAALKNEVTTNTKRYSTDVANMYLKNIDKGLDKMKKMQVKIRLLNEVLERTLKLQTRIEPFLNKTYLGGGSLDDILSSNELAQIKAVEVEYQEVEAYAKLNDVKVKEVETHAKLNGIQFRDSLKQDLAQIQERQNEAIALHAKSELEKQNKIQEDQNKARALLAASELEKQKLKHAKHIALAAATTSLLASIVIYVALHRRKVNRLKSRIEFLTKLEDGSTLAEEKQVLDTKVKLQDSKWKPFRTEIIEHLIEENKSIITGDARATISELVALRIGDGVQDFQSFLPPSVRLPASHYAPFLFTEEDVERFKAEQKNIANLLGEKLEPDYENETVVWTEN